MQAHVDTERCRIYNAVGVEDFIRGRPNVMREGISTFEIGTDNPHGERWVVVLEPSL